MFEKPRFRCEKGFPHGRSQLVWTRQAKSGLAKAERLAISSIELIASVASPFYSSEVII